MSLIHSIDHPVVNGIRVGKARRDGSYHLTSSCIVYHLGDTTIDTGPANQWAAINSYFTGQSITQVALTHHHEDHSGNGAAFQHQYGATVYSHPNNHACLGNGLKLSPIRKLTFGKVEPFKPQAVPSIIATSTGHRLQSIHTPGHTNDLVCYLEASEGWLFTGDLFVSSKLKYMTIEEDVSQWLISLKQVLSLDFETVFCSHRAVVHNGKQALKNKLDFFEQTCEQVAALQAKGMGRKAIRKQLFGREDFTSVISGFHMSKQKIVDSCLDHLNQSHSQKKAV